MAIPQFIFKQLASNSQLPATVKVINDLFTNLSQIFISLIKKPQLDSVVLQNVVLTVGNNQVPHTLGRALTGWKIIRMEGAFSQIYDTQASNTNPQTYLNLNSSVATTIALEVF